MAAILYHARRKLLIREDNNIYQKAEKIPQENDERFATVIRRRRGSRLSLPCILTTGWVIDHDWPEEPFCWSPYSAYGYKFLIQRLHRHPNKLYYWHCYRDRFVLAVYYAFYNLNFWHGGMQMRIRYDDRTYSRLGRFSFNYVLFYVFSFATYFVHVLVFTLGIKSHLVDNHSLRYPVGYNQSNCESYYT